MASTDTFTPSSIISQKLLDSVMASSFATCTSNGAFHGHIRDSAHAALFSPFAIDDFDALECSDALLFFDQDALMLDACHVDEHDMAQELSPSSTWSLDGLYSQEEVQNTAPAACTQHSPSTINAECDTPKHEEVLQVSKLSLTSITCDKSDRTHPFPQLSHAKNVSKLVDHDAKDGDDKEGKAMHSGRTSASKNIVSERKRRRKLNEKLYSLRAIVPKISKMDKASIVNDAIDYVQKLQKLVRDMEGDIHSLQTRAGGGMEEALRHVKDGVVSVTSMRKEVDYKIVKVDVTKMEEATYYVRILCLRGRGVFVKLAKALEALQLEIVNAYLTTVNDQILNTIVLKAKDGRSMEPRELREMILELVPRFGLGLAKEG